MSTRSLLLAAGVVLAMSAVPLIGQDQEQPLFRSGTELVDLFVTVTDGNGRLVPDLTREDFTVFDDGNPQEIVLFENTVRPITVVVMLDTSISTTNVMDRIMGGAEQFLIRMLPGDRARVGAFNDKIEIVPPEFIGDRDLLIGELDGLDFGNDTRLHDAVAASLNSLQDIEGRRVILVLTDGQDSASRIGWRDVLRQAVAEEVMIYSIGLEVEYFDGARNRRTSPDRSLRRLAEETGGGYFELRETDELGATFTRVSQELHSQYVLGFTPTVRDGETHELAVRLKQRGMSARARRSYVAPSDP
ncbi:MAG: VWA domain-containing protein [Acidobacteria bacterium]|nr:VWA domain-containing protein [Acidobacteriota bacterium]MCY4601318.1 VWA domain-containing protein [Acidobacteriota bacterium]